MGISRNEAASIRAQLKLRQNANGNWEVYTTAHGTGYFKWWIIDERTMLWYKQNFPEIKIVEFNTQEN